MTNVSFWDDGAQQWFDITTHEPVAPQFPPPPATPPYVPRVVHTAKTATEMINCETCGMLLGWVDECDLNGSYFFCSLCREKAL